MTSPMRKGAAMKWHNDYQRAFVGEDADRIAQAASAMHAMGLWPAQHVMRFKLDNGEAAWLCVTASGGLQCVAIAPWDDVWQCDSVHVGAFFGGGAWPATWRRKRAEMAPAVAQAHDWTAGWAIGLLPDKHTVQVCRVARFTGSRLDVVEIDEGIECAIAAHPAVKWWPYGRFHEGVYELWRMGRTTFHNYHLFAMQAAIQMRKLGLLPKVVRKPRQSSKD